MTREYPEIDRNCSFLATYSGRNVESVSEYSQQNLWNHAS